MRAVVAWVEARAVVAGMDVVWPAEMDVVWPAEMDVVQILDRATRLQAAGLLLLLAAHISAESLSGGRPTPDHELFVGHSAVLPELLSP